MIYSGAINTCASRDVCGVPDCFMIPYNSNEPFRGCRLRSFFIWAVVVSVLDARVVWDRARVLRWILMYNRIVIISARMFGIKAVRKIKRICISKGSVCFRLCFGDIMSNECRMCFRLSRTVRVSHLVFWICNDGNFWFFILMMNIHYNWNPIIIHKN